MVVLQNLYLLKPIVLFVTRDDGMKKVLFVVLMMVGMAVCMHGAAEINFTGWESVEIDDSLVNNTSTSVYTVMVPPGTTYFSNDTSAGPTTVLVNESDSNSVYGIYVFDNPYGKKLTTDTATIFLDAFMSGAEIIPVEGIKPVEVSDGLVLYGFQGEKAAGVYVLSNDKKVTVLSGFYPTIDAAAAGVENLVMIAGTITFLS